MINQLTHSLRIIFKYRLYTGISIIGLSIAISSIWFIANFVRTSKQYDHFHENQSRIYRLTMEVSTGDNTDHYATTGKPPGFLLQENYSGIEAYAKMTYYNPVVIVNEDIFKEAGFYSVNPEALDVFSFNFLKGDKKAALSDPNSIILSRCLAEKYFNTIDVIGKQITLDENEYIVKGVFEDWPENSHIDLKALTYSNEETANYEAQDWFDLEQYNYVLISSEIDQDELNNTLEELNAQEVFPFLEGSGIDVKFHSQELSGLYFAPGLIDDIPKGNMMYINALAIAGLLILLIAGLNFINLSLTRSTQRSKEIKLKKILGISRKQLFLQSGRESLLMTLLVLLISSIVVLVINEFYLAYTGFQSLSITENWLLLISLLLVLFIFGLLGTSYSGAYLSFSSKLITKEGKSVTIFKKVLLGLQFAIATVILIVTLTMNKQIDFMKNKDLGFSKEQILIINLPDNEELMNKRIQFREQIKNFASTRSASLIGSGALPGEDNGKELFEVTINGNKSERVYNIYRIDENYSELFDIKLALGRNFQANRLSDQNDAVIINEELAKSLNWKNPLGKKIWCYGQEREVIGVVKNFHNKSLHNLIEPIVFMFDTNYSTKLLVKTNSSDVSMIKTSWADFFPNVPYSYTYFDQFIGAMYAKEDRLAKLLGFFSIVSLALCCMGLFALFSLQILQTTKEMSIRKILGANAINLLKSVTQSYVIVAFIVIVIAIPVAWFLLNDWLEVFKYKIQMTPTVFTLSVCLVLFASFLAIAYHIIKALKTNPVDSLKYD